MLGVPGFYQPRFQALAQLPVACSMIRQHKVNFLFLVLQVTYKWPGHEAFFVFFLSETKVERKWCTKSKVHCRGCRNLTSALAQLPVTCSTMKQERAWYIFSHEWHHGQGKLCKCGHHVNHKKTCPHEKMYQALSCFTVLWREAGPGPGNEARFLHDQHFPH